MRTTALIGASLATLAACRPSVEGGSTLERRQFEQFAGLLGTLNMNELQQGLNMFGGVGGVMNMRADPAKVEDLEPVIRKDATRKRLWYGPYTLPAVGDEHAAKTAKMPMQMDPNSVQINKAPTGWCKDCTVLYGKSVLYYANGTVAEVSRGVYEHHVVVIDMTKKNTPFYLCEGQKGFLGKLPAEGFIVSGNDLAANYFSTPDGKFDSGYYLSPKAAMVMQAELVNYSPVAQEIYVTMEYEYLPGRTAANDASVSLISVTGCEMPDYHAPADQPQYNVSSARVPLPVDGYIINAKGHLHDGGTNIELFLNDKLVCNSKAVYGADGLGTGLAPNGKRWEVITEMTQCAEPVPVKKGDILHIETHYDNDLHPPRMAADGHSGDSDEMGVFFLNLAVPNKKVP